MASDLALILLVLVLLVRGNNYRHSAKYWRAKSDDLRGRTEALLNESTRRSPDVVTKLRDRAVSLETQLIAAQDEIRKRDAVIARLQAMVPPAARVSH